MRRIASLGTASLALLFSCASYHQSSAQSSLAQGRLDEAAAEVQSALVSNPDDLQLKHLAAQIFTQRGVKYYQNKEMIAAGDDFHRAADYDRFYSQAWDYLGLIAFSQHKWADAIDYGHKAAELAGKPDPTYVQQADAELVKVRTGGLRPRHRAHSQSGARRRSGGPF